MADVKGSPGRRTTLSPPKKHHIDKRAPDLIGHDAEVDEDELLSTGEVAAWLKVSTQFLEIGRLKGYGPKFIRLSARRIRYRRDDVRAWLLARAHAATSEYDTGYTGRGRKRAG